MRKILIFSLCLMLGICFSDCSRQRNLTDNQKEWKEIYRITLNSYIEGDMELYKYVDFIGLDFIAIDLETLKFANDSDKESIVEWFEMQYLPVKNTNLDGLIEEGLYVEGFIQKGFLLKIDIIYENTNEIIIKGTKYRGQLSANGFETKWVLNKGIWEFAGTVMTWIT